MPSDLRARLQVALGAAYRVEHELSPGGMSRVFVADEVALGRKVVVKVLPPDISATVNLDRFQREIQLTASLQHPNIVPLLAAGSADGLVYYTMPLVKGESLRAKITREGELPLNDAIRLLRDIADALACAHESGIIHRDIKPDNILITHHHALVADFGVAKALSTASGDAYHTVEGVTLGTPAYMGPEQATADPDTNHRADLYALGVVGYEMLTGNTPFPGLVGQAALMANVTRPVPPITTARPSVPAPLAALIMRCLEKHPADRWQSASELLDRLEAMARPSEAPISVPPAYRSSRVRRRAILLAGAAVAAALFLLTVILRRSEAGASLDPQLIAVAPFDAIGGDLELWREGLVDILSRNLDGAGPLRTVPPSVVIRRWAGRADVASALALGRRSEAGLAVFGSLLAVGRDSVRLAATILDVARNHTIGEVELRGETGHMDRLADSLAVSLLRDLGRARGIAAVSTVGLRATSLPALKAFLQGEQLYRRGVWDSAETAYRRALAHDSTIVPALLHLGWTLGWRAGGQVEPENYAFRASELNRGLSRRDSLLVTADSINAAIAQGATAAVHRSLRRRLWEALEYGVRLYPEDPEFWYLLGERRFHLGWRDGVSPVQTLEALDRAIALDSGFTPAYFHATTLGLILYGLDGWDRYARPLLAARPRQNFGAETTGLLDAILKSSPADPGRIDSILSVATPDQIYSAVVELWHFPDSAETAVRLARALVASRGPATGPARHQVLRWHTLAAALAYRGRFREGLKILENREAPWPSLTAGIILLGGTPPESVDARFERSLQQGSLWTEEEGPPGVMLFALPWWAARRDTLALRVYANLADSMKRVAPEFFHEDAEYAGEAAGAYSLLARGDTIAALRRFQTLPHDLHWFLERVTEGQILTRLGRHEEALELFENAFWPETWGAPMRVLARLEAGKVAERLGQAERAAGHLRFVADVWRHADPELHGYVREARAGIQRLVARTPR